MKEIIIIIIMTVPRAVGVLMLGLDSPISPVVMTARLQEPAMLSSGHYTEQGGGESLPAWKLHYKIPLFRAFISLGKNTIYLHISEVNQIPLLGETFQKGI